MEVRGMKIIGTWKATGVAEDNHENGLADFIEFTGIDLNIQITDPFEYSEIYI